MPGVTTAYQNGIHSARPAANAGCILYACSTHSLIYRSDGSSWTTWMTIGSSTTTVESDAIWDAAGDIAVGTGADTAAKLTLGASGKVLASNGSTVAYAYPPGYELDRVTITSTANVTATSSGTADTVITSNSVTFDGASWDVEFYSMGVTPASGATADISVLLRDDTAGTIVAYMAYITSQAANAAFHPVLAKVRVAPAAGARVYSIRAFVSGGTGQVAAGAGGGAANAPAYVRIVKA